MCTCVDNLPGRLLDFLDEPGNYPERPSHVERVETHISWVFLTDRFAYKLKKPVRFSFLDFSTLAKRQAACLDEVRLNRRLAEDVYLGVVPLACSAAGQVTWDGSGAVVDWLVKMRRLPSDASLANQLAHHSLSQAQLTTLTEFLTDFYRRQPPLTLRPDQIHAQLAAHIRANQADLATLLPDDAERIGRIHAGQLAYLDRQSELFRRRVCDGRYVEGHGDLRPDHIYLLPRAVVIDCIEFSSELRRLDILDELGFLAMECDHAGCPRVGEAIVANYGSATSDQAPPPILDFYKSYRACVRAKVAALRASQGSCQPSSSEQHEATAYLQLAEQYVTQFSRPLLLVISGLMGSGKSTLAEALATTLGAEWLQTDQLRREQFGRTATDAAFGAGDYSAERRTAIYDLIFARCQQELGAGHSVVLDGTFSSREQRRRAGRLAQLFGANGVLVECVCPRSVALQRIDERRARWGALSDARAELYDQQAAAWEPPDGAESWPSLIVDSTLSLPQQVQQVLDEASQRYYRLSAGTAN